MLRCEPVRHTLTFCRGMPAHVASLSMDSLASRKMRRPSRSFRILGLLLGAWFVLSGVTSAMRECSMHGVGGAMSHSSHKPGTADPHTSHSEHESVSAPVPTEHHESHRLCDCVSECCTSGPPRLASTNTVEVTTVLVAGSVGATVDVVRPPSLRPRLLPFANGPPGMSCG